MRSIDDYGLSMTGAIFTQGRAPYEYIGALDVSLFLSGNRPDVDAAIGAGFPAGRVLASTGEYDEDDPSFRIVFDFDGVLADDASERWARSSARGHASKSRIASRVEDAPAPAANSPDRLHKPIMTLVRVDYLG